MTEYACDSFRFFNLFPVYFGGKGTHRAGLFPIGQANANLAELATGLNDFLLGGAAGGRLVFSFESSSQVDPMMDSTINGKLSLT